MPIVGAYRCHKRKTSGAFVNECKLKDDVDFQTQAELKVTSYRGSLDAIRTIVAKDGLPQVRHVLRK